MTCIFILTYGTAALAACALTGLRSAPHRIGLGVLETTVGFLTFSLALADGDTVTFAWLPVLISWRRIWWMGGQNLAFWYGYQGCLALDNAGLQSSVLRRGR